MDLELTDRESDVMRVLWHHGPSLVAEVQELLADSLAYTTVLTILRILESKGFVGHSKAGKGYRYRALVEEHRAQRSALARLTDKLFRGSTELMLVRLMENEPLDRSQRERLRKILADAPAAAKPRGKRP
ncbi:MAG TPA: BlaI/MecI/CopY family transcriptional regulator [Steroidobacteraceae bacterium]